MGQFSWIYSDTKKALLDGVPADTYLLVPKPFQEKYGKAIYESCYDGYGNFGGYDVYDLIPEWNRDMVPEIIRRIRQGEWECSVDDEEISDLQNYYEGKPITCNLRHLGIILACYNEDNFKLKYPIKITTKELDYDSVTPSKSDPNQGWGNGADYDWDEEDEEDW